MPLDRDALAKLRRKQQNGLFSIAVEMTNQSKRLATRNVDNGTRRNSLTQTKTNQGGVLWGIPLSSAPHAVYLELGFRPRWVPMRHLHLWAKRVGVGQVRETRTLTRRRVTSRRRYKTTKAVALGVFVGGPNSRLQYGGGGATAEQFAGRGRRIRRTYPTRGGRSNYLPPGKVGSPILVPVVREKLRGLAPNAFMRGYKSG